MTPTYKLHELAEEAGVSPRTVRYYVQRGLLPAPEFRGKDTAYGQEHLLRLHAIKRLQQTHLPLDEIQDRLAHASDTDLLQLTKTDVPAARVPFEEPRDTGPVENHGHPYRSSGRQQADAISTERQSTARVYQLATGVELWVRDGAPAASHALASEILNRYSTTHDDKDADQ